MKSFVYLSTIIALFLCTACGSTHKYAATTLLQETRVHQEIALLPVEIQYEGPVPAFMEDSGQAYWQAQESKTLTRELYQAFKHRKQQNVMIAIQKPGQTWALLEEAGVGPQDLKNMHASELAEILKVDAVVRTVVAEHRFYEERFPINRWMGEVEMGHRASPLREIMKGHLKTA
ncbi:MAG: hypothetical protein AAFV07_01510, partial [Bacteroidota bacterium]